MGSVTQLFPHAVLRRLPADAPSAVACVTLDFERDYGSRTDRFALLEHESGLEQLRAFFERARIPLSVFVVTELLERWPHAERAARFLGDDWHCHSHTHSVDPMDTDVEIARSTHHFRRAFGAPPLGYRAPMGLLRPEDPPRLAAAGYRFSASVFPSYRPGRFNHVRHPTLPLRYANGLLELPFGVIQRVRIPISISYFKLLGVPWGLRLLRTFGAPPVVVINFHLHDVMTDDTSLALLPRSVRLAYGWNRGAGLDVLRALARHFQDSGYTFLSMTTLYEICARGSFGSVGGPR